VTETALRTAKAVVVLWWNKSVQSRWVRAEATLADRNKTLVLCMIEPCERPIMFELTQTAELSHWLGDAGDKAWVNFLADVQRFAAKGAPSTITRPIARLLSTPAPTPKRRTQCGRAASSAKTTRRRTAGRGQPPHLCAGSGGNACACRAPLPQGLERNAGGKGTTAAPDIFSFTQDNVAAAFAIAFAPCVQERGFVISKCAKDFAPYASL
jgi:hypothetical protein